MKPRKRGFSLTEILIAIVVLAIALSGLASALFFGFVSGQYADERAFALAYARQYIEIIKANSTNGAAPAGLAILNAGTISSNLTQADGTKVKLDAPPFGTTGTSNYAGMGSLFSGPDAARYTRNIQVNRYGPTVGGVQSLAEIRVRIYWMNHGVERMLEVRAHDSAKLSTP